MTPEEVLIIEQIESEVKAELEQEGTGHDWWHIKRVYEMAKKIAREEAEPVDMFVVETAALLHDIADWKFHHGDENAGPKRAREILTKLGVKEEIIKQVTTIIKNISFKGAYVADKISSLEGQIVQDADRLDALGAIGILRAGLYSGWKGQLIHDPKYDPKFHKTFEEYKNQKTTTIAHFYEKLLLLKDRMHTQIAKKIAEGRHEYMEGFLERFYKEWKTEL